MLHSLRIFVKALSAGLLFLPAASAWAIDAFPGSLPGTTIHQSLPAGYEPSGCVWHPRLQQLFLVSDGGTVSRMDPDGNNVVSWSVPGDIESITLADPDSDLVYVGVEEPPAIIEFNFMTGQELRRFDLSAWIIGAPNQLLEAIAFVPDLSGANPEGGVFYAGNQFNGEIHVFSLPIRSSASSTVVAHLNSFSPLPGWGDLADLYYDLDKNLLWAVWDYENVIVLMTPAGSILGQWDLPGFDQEGVAINGCTLYIGEDSGRVMKYDFIGLGGDQDNDGVMDCADRCPGTAAGASVDSDGCSCEQKTPGDDDGDAVPNCDDLCPATPAGELVDSDGCACQQRAFADADADGVSDCIDACPGTPAGQPVDSVGCPLPADHPGGDQSGGSSGTGDPDRPTEPPAANDSTGVPRSNPPNPAPPADDSSGRPAGPNSENEGANEASAPPAAQELIAQDATALAPVVPAFACGNAGAVSFMTTLLLPFALRGRTMTLKAELRVSKRARERAAPETPRPVPRL